MVFGEIAEEGFENLLLLFREIRSVVEFMDVGHVGKELVSISHVLVYVVEIAYEHSTPVVEVVERLVFACYLDEAFIQVADQLYGVSHFCLGILAEEFADGEVVWRPHGLAGTSIEFFVEK